MTRAALWGLWLAGALYATLHHVMWRDEIRALSLAERGGTLAQMIVDIRGYGHPALWHVILRSGLALYDSPVVLPLVAFAIGAAGAALLAFRAPFRPLLLALALFGAFSLYEYVAVARNYGLSVLLLYGIAAAWRRYGDRPGAIGALLFLLCNANVHSVVLAGALLLFWLIELVREPGRDRTAWRSFAVAVALTTAGTALCFWQVYPPVDTAAMLPPSGSGPAAFLSGLVVNVGPSFHELMPPGLRSLIPVVFILPVLLVLSITSLRASSAAMIASAAALAGLILLFAVIYPGFYRHQSLFIAFLLAMTWIVAERHPDRAPAARSPGAIAFLLLLALQVWTSVAVFAQIAAGVPESRSRDLAMLLERPALRNAVVIGDPDTMLEALPYYTDNPIYLVREGRFARTPTFSYAAQTTMTVGQLLSAARALNAGTGRPVVIVMAERLEPDMTAGVRERGYYGPLRIEPAEVRAFLGATRRLARFGPATTDESYDVYVLERRAGGTR